MVLLSPIIEQFWGMLSQFLGASRESVWAGKLSQDSEILFKIQFGCICQMEIAVEDPFRETSIPVSGPR